MSLSSALDTAKSSLIASQTHTALVSRNIANLNTEGATRKYANVVTGIGGRVEVASIAQSQNSVLFRNMLDSSSAVGAWSTLASGYQRIDEVIGDTTLARSPAARISNLSDALQAYASNPSSSEFARAALDAARDLTTSITEVNATVETVRRDADNSLASAAEDMNRLLGEIEALNKKVVQGTAAGTDVTDFVDKRDQAVTALSEYVGVTARIRGDNDLVLHTDSGVTLFDTKARLVEFTPTSPLQPGVSGNAFKIDGVTVTGASASMPLKSGAVVGLTTLRDEVAVTFQTQLDEIARALVLTFAESDQRAGGTLGSLPGLFTASGGSLDLAQLENGEGVAGLAGRLKIADRAIETPTLIRDGGINVDPDHPGAFLYNSEGSAGFSTRILGLADALGGTRGFSAEAGIGTSATLVDFAASSLGWLQAGRAGALSETEYRTTIFQRTQETLSNETGVNLAEEMTLLTDLQRSYQAAAKLISTVDDMLATLLQSV
ncbi:flagellar hook-associated protein FlgK [Aureimonas populi]|uniref:Flagellar hook-associated protein 1 n=1 Tax=Aureimonas populi TaxID=1701758 RepID=A0ABW5CI53_9HYPH|nr:flagellar hook-associated protein FlgK [Aureimonas populi]